MIKKVSIKFVIVSITAFIYLAFPSKSYSQLLLNEMMSSNTSTLQDQFNNFSDWIEIYNSGDSIIQLSDYWLSDDSAQLKKWNFPAMEFNSNSYNIVFASGMDIAADNNEIYWHTLIDAGEEWKYFIPTSNIDEAWKSSAAITTGWETGSSGFGYGDGDDATDIGDQLSSVGAVTLYIQKTIEVSSVEELIDAALFMDYDDGFIAYLNGTEIARSLSMGSPGIIYAYDEVSSALHEASMYNGGLPEAYFFTDFIDLFVEGGNVLSIEVHNANPGSSDMSAIPFLYLGFSRIRDEYTYGSPYLSDKEAAFSHTNFRIKSGGETIFLADSIGNIIDSIKNVRLLPDYSYGRVPLDTVEFGYFDQATPGAENTGDYYTEFFTDSVFFVSSGKDYDSFQSVTMNSDMDDDIIYYTTDGSEPNDSSLLYTSPITINNTTAIRARIYRPGKLPGPITTKTFFTDQGHDLPVIAVTMNPFDLYDYNSGIYVMGPNAESSNPYFGANFWQDWEKPVNIEIYNNNKELVLSQTAGTKIFGAWSRARPQKSQAFFARNIYGDGSFSYPLFSEKPMKQYESFVLRNGGNDYCLSMFRDGLSAYMSSSMNVDHQAYEPYVMYLNGEYYGMMNMREKINEHFIAGNHNVYPEDVNLLEVNRQVIYGSQTSYYQLIQFISSNDMSVESNYEHVTTLMDIQNFMSYWALNVFIDNKDWPGNNIKYWSLNAPGSLFRWIAYDTDFGYGLYDGAFYVNTLEFSLEPNGPGWPNPSWSTLIARKLVENEEFERRFINEFADRMNTTLLPDNILPVVDSFQQRIRKDVYDHFRRWEGSMTSWNNEINSIKTFLNQRPKYMKDHLMERFNISGMHTIEIDISNPVGGYVHLNAMDLKDYPFSGEYFDRIPIDLVAIPNPGYKFSHWEGDMESNYAQIQYDMKASGSFTAVFEPLDYSPNIVINEINYASNPEQNTEDWVELYNHSDGPVNLKGWTIWDRSSGEYFEVAEKSILQPKEYLVLSRSMPDLKRFFPELKHLLGNLSYGINNEGDGIALIDPEQRIHDVVDFLNVNPWPTDPNGSGATLELLNPRFDNSQAESWKASKDNTGTPGARNSQYEILDGIENEIFASIQMNVYPSPFSEFLNIRIDLDRKEGVEINIYSITGELVHAMKEIQYVAGLHILHWTPGVDIPKGLYLVEVKTKSSRRSFKVIYQ